MADAPETRIAKILPLPDRPSEAAPTVDRSQAVSHQVVRILRAMLRGVKSAHDGGACKSN